MDYTDKNGELTYADVRNPGKGKDGIYNQSADLTCLLAVEENQYRVISVNHTFLIATKLSRKDVEGKLLNEFVPEMYLSRYLKKLDLAVQGQEAIQWEDSFDYPDGTRTGLVTVTPVIGGQDVCTMLVTSIHEITERIRKEEWIKVREAHLDLMYNTVSDVIFLVSVEGNDQYRFISINNAFVDATGLKREAVEGRLVSEVIPSSSLAMVLGKYSEAISGRRMIQWEETSPYPRGLRTGIVSLTPVFDEAGKCSRLVGSVHDITEEKRIERERDLIDFQLKNRVRELTTLFKIGQVLQADSTPVDQFLKELAEIIAQGWQYPDITRVRIAFGTDEYVMPGFEAGIDRQTAAFTTPDGQKGMIEVVYIDSRPSESDGPFLAEEGSLILSVAERLRLYFARLMAMDQLIREKALSDNIIETLPGLFYIIDESSQEIRWNKRLQAVTGYSSEEIGRMKAVEFTVAEDKEMIERVIRDAYLTGGFEAEVNLRTKWGEVIPYFFNGVVIEYEGRRCLMGTGIDISFRRRMEIELKDAEAKFRTLVEKSQVGVYIYQNGTYVYVNPRFAEIFGYEPNELYGPDSVKTVVAEEYRHITTRYIADRLSGKIGSTHYETRGIKKDGREIRIEVFGSRTIYNGETAILGTTMDITERKLAEEALQRSEANLHTVFDTTDTIYMLLDKSFQIQVFNERARHYMTKEMKKELLIQTNILSYFPQERHSILIERMNRVMDGQQVSYESSNQQDDGSLGWYSFRMFPIRNQESEVLGLMIAISDITEKKIMEQALLHQRVEEQRRITRAVLNGQERERNKIGQELHDNVNQILAGAKMSLGLTNELEGKNEVLIAQAIQLLDNAINEIRALSSEQVTPERRIDLKEMIESLISKLNDNSGVSAEFIFENEGVPISDDLKLNIYRIIQECVNNILKHSEATTAFFLVSVSMNALEVRVSDDGKGFDTSGRTKGVGISNMTNRIESYNGTLRISSSPGNGCVVRLVVPL